MDKLLFCCSWLCSLTVRPQVMPIQLCRCGERGTAVAEVWLVLVLPCWYRMDDHEQLFDPYYLPIMAELLAAIAILVASQLEKKSSILSCVICPYCLRDLVKMKHAVYFSIGHANGKFAGSVRLPRAAELSLSHFG